MSPTDEPERFFFVHMQKTAGTTLLRRIRHHFGDRAVYPLPEEQGRPETSLGTDELQERFALRRHEIRVVTGHFPLCTAELLGVPFRTFTVLREPVERSLSNLRHAKKVDPKFRDVSLEAIYEQDGIRRDGLLRNHMVRMLSLEVDEMDAGAMTQVVDDDERLERAKRNLERLDVMGCQEHFDAFCGDLATRFGWDLGAPLFSNRTPPDVPSDDLVERIVEDNRYDLELYRFACELREQRSATASD